MTKSVLITGANAGLGFEAARQLAERGWSHIVLSARSQSKANDARQRLAKATGRESGSFGIVVFDNNKPGTIRSAVKTLEERGTTFDAVILNAGGLAHPDENGRPVTTDEGLSATFAMNVGGHAVLVQGLLDAGLLPQGATVVFSGSEAARGVPVLGMRSPQLPLGLGNIDATVDAIAHNRHVDLAGYDPAVDYGMVKLFGTLWMRHLAEAQGLRALTVSPGFTAGTNALSRAPTVQRILFGYIALPLLRLFRNAHGVETGAKRYVQALEDPSLQPGRFYASPGRRVSGTLTDQDSELQPLLDDDEFASAVVGLIKGLSSVPHSTAIAS